MTRVALLLMLAVLASACSTLVAIEPIRVSQIDLGVQAQTSVVMSADGVQLAELHAEQDRDPVPLAEIPAWVGDAVIAVEDARFYEHPGVDGRAVARALVTNVIEADIVQGGSTITQQLIKNTIVGNDQTIDRKLTEASLALQLEAQLSKDEILERYLNVVYFGNGAYGVGAAARRYFRTDIGGLQLHQAALLAGMLKAPATYDPYDRPSAATARRNLVLGLMAEQGLVTEAEADAARGLPLDVLPLPPSIDWQHPYVVDHALDVLQHDPVYHVLGDTPAERAAVLFGGGLTIETTVTTSTQLAAEVSIRDTLVDPGVDPHAALVATDPRTGEIQALVGGRDYTDPTDPVARFNLATDGLRQPGSSFKPLVLAAALEAGWHLEDTLPAPAQISVAQGPGLPPWTVSNAAGRGYEDLTLRTATALSINTVYAQMVDAVGADAVVEIAQRSGITDGALEPLSSIALGAQDVSVLDMATVTSTLAASGVRRDPGIIRRITDRDGIVIWERPPDPGLQVIDEEVARQVTLAMQDVVTSGTGSGAAIGRPVAGKTGTSQDNVDAWFTGFTPDLAVAVWVGFPEGRVPMVPPRTRTTVQGGGWPAEIFARFGVAALAEVPATPFDIAGDLATVTVDLTRDCLPNPYTPRNLIGERGYVPGTEPTETCTEPSGPPTVDVPMIEGMGVAQATEALNLAGFTVVEEPQYSPSVPPGQVLEQVPGAGPDQLLAETGYVATIHVATAEERGTTVPDVLNRQLVFARDTLEEEGFVVRVRVGCPGAAASCAGATERPGVVWQQSPEAGTDVPAFSEVVLDVYPG